MLDETHDMLTSSGELTATAAAHGYYQHQMMLAWSHLRLQEPSWCGRCRKDNDLELQFYGKSCLEHKNLATHEPSGDNITLSR